MIGKEVTVIAEVEVKDNESAAGIPVTFNIPSDNNFNDRIVEEVYTNEDGVAKFSYTRYEEGTDSVIAYATGDADVRDSGARVYWGEKQPLVLEEVTEDNTLPNGAKKTYKIKANHETINDNAFVYVMFEENIDAKPHDGVTDVYVTDANDYSHSTRQYPYQYSNDTSNYVQIELEDGEATFTITGEDASVTPIVYAGTGSGTKASDQEYDTNDLQAKAPTVTFDEVEFVELEVQALGTENAAAIEDGVHYGGREYKVTVKNKEGKTAPAGVDVHVALDDFEGDVYLYEEDDDAVVTLTQLSDEEDEYATLETNKDGEITFRLVGEDDAWAAPVFFIDNGSKSKELDSKDTQEVGKYVYFGDVEAEEAIIKVVERGDNLRDDAVKDVKAREGATFIFQVVDQNGFPYTGDVSSRATWEVKNEGFNTIYAAGVAITAGETKSIDLRNVVNGQATLNVTADGETTATVSVNGSGYTLSNKTASVDFTADTVDVGVGLVVDLNTTKQEITLFVDGIEQKVSYAGAKWYVGGDLKSRSNFERALEDWETVDTFVEFRDGDVKEFDVVAAPTNATEIALNYALSQDNANETLSANASALEISGDNAVLDLGGYTVTNLTITGEDVEVKNGTVTNLTVAASVDEGLVLDGVTVTNKTTFNGGGSESVELTGGTALQGEVVFSGDAVRVFGTGTISAEVSVETDKEVELDDTVTVSGDVIIADANAKVSVPAGTKVYVAEGVKLSSRADVKVGGDKLDNVPSLDEDAVFTSFEVEAGYDNKTDKLTFSFTTLDQFGEDIKLDASTQVGFTSASFDVVYTKDFRPEIVLKNIDLEYGTHTIDITIGDVEESVEVTALPDDEDLGDGKQLLSIASLDDVVFGIHQLEDDEGIQVGFKLSELGTAFSSDKVAPKELEELAGIILKKGPNAIEKPTEEEISEKVKELKAITIDTSKITFDSENGILKIEDGILSESEVALLKPAEEYKISLFKENTNPANRIARIAISTDGSVKFITE